MLERIGRGSLAEAYKAKSFGVEGFEKTLVVKWLLSALANRARFVESFVREAKLAVRLSHANVVQVIDLGRDDSKDGSRYYVASEYVAGMSLHELLGKFAASRRIAPLELVLYVASELAKALDHAHRRRDEQLRPLGIVHRDLSPKNVLLSWEGEVKLADFCVTKAFYDDPDAAPHTLSEKARYASPELVRGETVTAQSDIFGVGALMFESLTGAHPFSAPTLTAMRERVRVADCDALDRLRPDLSPTLTGLVHQMLGREPRQRPDGAARLHELVLAELYAAGSRFGAAELADLLERQRGSIAPAEPVARALDSIPPELRPGARDSGRPSEPTLSGLTARREISALLLKFAGAPTATGREHVRLLLLRHGGRVLRETPTEIAAVFGLEQQDARDAENAVRCALVVMNDGNDLPTCCAGLEVGRLRVSHDGTPTDAPGLDHLFAAARALAVFEGRIAIAEHAERNLRGVFDLDLPPPIAGDVSTWLVRGLRSIDGAAAMFVGRRNELRRIGERLAHASRRELQVTGIVGEPGIGKTELLLEMRRRIEKSHFDIAMYLATCPPRGHEYEFSALVAMLRALCGVREGDRQEALESVAPRLRTLGLRDEEVQAVLSELGRKVRSGHADARALLPAAFGRMLSSLAEDRVQVFVWDDAHEMDAESAALIGGVLERLVHARILVLLAARPNERSHFKSFPSYSEVALGALEPDDLFKLVGKRLGVEDVPESLLEFLRTRAAGHPMFVEELIHEAVECGAVSVRHGRIEVRLGGALAIPRPLRTLLADRVRRLPEPEQELVAAASVLGAPAEIAVLAAMLGRDQSSLDVLVDSLEQRGLVRREETSGLGFHSSLLPEVVLAGLEPDALVELHRKAAAAYELAAGAADGNLNRLARHLAEAGECTRAAETFATSGLSAVGARRLDQAASDLSRALDLALIEGRPTSELAEWVSALSGAVRRVSGGKRLHDLVQRLMTRVESDTALDPRRRARMTIDLGVMLVALHHYRDARRLLERAAFDSAPWPDLARAAHTVDAELAFRLGEFNRALSALDRVRRLPAAAPAERHRLLVTTAQALAGAGQHDRALAALGEAKASAPIDDPVLACERTKVRAVIFGFAGRWRECAETAAQAAEQGRTAGLLYEVAVNLHNEDDAWLRGGELPRAYAALRASLSVAEEMGSERLININQIWLAYLEALNGSEAAKVELGERLLLAESRRWAWDALSARYLLGRLLAAQGDVLGARRELELAQGLAATTGNRLISNDCARELARLI